MPSRPAIWTRPSRQNVLERPWLALLARTRQQLLPRSRSRYGSLWPLLDELHIRPDNGSNPVPREVGGSE
jgi:hypothetical protein